MARIITLYLLGLLQGISFTLIPGASAFLASGDEFHLSSEQYGQLFIPMVLAAILFSFFGGAVARRWGIRRVTVVSCMINLLSMVFFAVSQGYLLLLVCMFFLGAGFGANLSTLNSYVLEFFPKRSSAALTALHATLGIGTALGPLLFAVALSVFVWWLAPALLALGYLIFAFCSKAYFPLYLNLPVAQSGKLKNGVWIFALIAFFYGISETTFGNWGILYLKGDRHFSSEVAALSLSLFWSFVTIGRILSALISVKISPKWIYSSIGFVLLASVIVLNESQFAILSFLFAGLGCSAFLPLTVSFAQKQDLPHAEGISGMIIALYMLGYGVSAFGVGWLEVSFHFSLEKLFFYLLIPTFMITLLSLVSSFFSVRRGSKLD